MMMMKLARLLRFLSALCMWQLMCCICSNVNARQNGHMSRYRSTFQQRSSIDVKDKIIEYQCYAKCGNPMANTGCHKQCREDLMKLPRRGSCLNKQGSIFQNISPLQKLSCLDNCSYDYDCPEVQKCCDSSCGPVCMDAIGVRDDQLLPPIPRILRHKLPRGHKVEITIQSSANSDQYCHVESRYHIGSFFSARKLSAWQWQPVEKTAEVSDTKSKRIDISFNLFNLRPGRWYQVRVAAINAYGFRGYSEPSKEFTLPNHPKPPKQPADLQVAASNFNGRFYTVKIVWCPSKSNLPIEKYKIIWSLYVRNRDESLISSEAYVKDAHQFEITELLPDSSYYIQVQAMSISGSRRLKSDKSSILHNTTTSFHASPYTPLKCSQQFSDEGDNSERVNMKEAANVTSPEKPPFATEYEVRFRLNRKFGMIVRITGFHPNKEKVYELCPKETNCEQREYSAIRAKKDSLEFSKLKYNTTYIMKAYKATTDGADESEPFTFTTPKCENFRKRFPKMQITC